jgi:flagellar basal-body rod protein FlgB
LIYKILNGTRLLEKSLDATWKNNEAISQNIANVDTPGYKRKTVPFSEYLDEAMSKDTFTGRRTRPHHVSIGSSSDAEKAEPRIVQDDTGLSMRLDGNNVDIESEMASLAKNSIQYDTLTQSLNYRFRSIKSAINEGRR